MADLENDPEWKKQELQQEEEMPELYSKTLILVFAILFSTIFAAALLMLNLRSLGKIKEANLVLLFAIVYFLATAIAMETLKLDPSLTLIANVIGAAILNEFFWNKFIGREVEFTPKSWIKPTVISGIIVMVFLLLMMGSM